MIQEIATVSIDGQVQDDLVPDIAEIEVEEHVDSADVFRVRISLAVQNDGTWSYLDDDRFTVWNQLQIVGGYPTDNATLIDGYITHVKASLSGPGTEDSFLEITGMDGSALMDLEEKQVAWPNKKDSDIAQQVFASYGFSWEVEDTQLQHAEAVATILQSESDIRFLRRLAARNGFECYVQGKRGFFRSPNLQDPPQKILAIQFGDQTNLASLTVEVDGTPPTLLEIRRIDPVEKREDRETLADLPRRALGRRTLKAIRSNRPDGRRLVKQCPAAGTIQLKSELRSAYEAAAEFVLLSGEIDSRAYGAVLRAKKLVTVKGAGATHSGLYYVTRVRHRFTAEGYQQTFEAYRNGTGLTGTENLAAPVDPSPAIPGLPAAGAAAGNRLLPASATLGGI
ncbi:MAG TPA: contractile injection system protein, VgrG/Pvc8 family [Kofleriaceae bacterium]